MTLKLNWIEFLHCDCKRQTKLKANYEGSQCSRLSQATPITSPLKCTRPYRHIHKKNKHLCIYRLHTDVILKMQICLVGSSVLTHHIATSICTLPSSHHCKWLLVQGMVWFLLIYQQFICEDKGRKEGGKERQRREEKECLQKCWRKLFNSLANVSLNVFLILCMSCHGI